MFVVIKIYLIASLIQFYWALQGLNIYITFLFDLRAFCHFQYL